MLIATNLGDQLHAQLYTRTSPHQLPTHVVIRIAWTPLVQFTSKAVQEILVTSAPLIDYTLTIPLRRNQQYNPKSALYYHPSPSPSPNRKFFDKRPLQTPGKPGRSQNATAHRGAVWDRGPFSILPKACCYLDNSLAGREPGKYTC